MTMQPALLVLGWDSLVPTSDLLPSPFHQHSRCEGEKEAAAETLPLPGLPQLKPVPGEPAWPNLGSNLPFLRASVTFSFIRRSAVGSLSGKTTAEIKPRLQNGLPIADMGTMGHDNYGPEHYGE